MSISLDTERKRKKPKNAVFAAHHHVVASAGNTKVKFTNDDGPAADSASVAERTGFIISSSSKTMIQSILTLFAVYDQISTQHKINSVDAVSHDIAASHVKLEFKLVKRGKGSGGRHEVAIFQRNASSKAVTCASLRDFMEARTTAMSYQRVLRMAEMIYEQMTALEGLGLAPPYYGLDDILVINESFFCFINDAKLFAIEAGSDARRRRIDVTQAISRTAAFFAPELIGGISALPYSAHVQSSYYSYGLLVAYCATFNSKLITTSHEKGQEDNERKEEDEEEEEKDDEEEKDEEEEKEKEEEEEDEEKGGDEEIDQQSGGKRRRRNKHKRQHQEQEQSDRVKTRNRQPNLMRALEPLQYTKLYWLILRCCDPDVSRRSIIYL
jgi:hypothetical protein